MFFGGGDFQLWKLHTFGDYLAFFSFVLVGLVVFVLIVRHMNAQRNHEAAVKKVIRRLKRLAKKPFKIYSNAAFLLESGKQQFDGVLMDRSGIYLLKAYGWGTKIYGTPEGENWRREDPKRKEEFPNPLLTLKKGAEEIKKVLEANGVPGVKIMPMVVFADNYQTPELYLGYGSFSTTYQEMKIWYKKQSAVKEAQYDFNRVSSILNGIQTN